MTTIAERTDRQTVLLFATLAAILGLLVLMLVLVYQHYGTGLINIEFDGTTYQGVGHCVLVADVYTGVPAETSANRLEIKRTEDCDLCTDSWTMPGSKNYRVRLFVRPCHSPGFIRSP
jgi:hypothetical protein